MAANFFWTFLILLVFFFTLWALLTEACKKDNSAEKYKKVIKVYMIIWTYSLFGCVASSIWWIWS